MRPAIRAVESYGTKTPMWACSAANTPDWSVIDIGYGRTPHDAYHAWIRATRHLRLAYSARRMPVIASHNEQQSPLANNEPLRHAASQHKPE